MVGEANQKQAQLLATFIDIELNQKFETNYQTAGAYVQTKNGPVLILWEDLSVASINNLKRPKTDFLAFLREGKIETETEGGPMRPVLFVDPEILPLLQLSREGLERIGGRNNIPEGMLPPGDKGPKSFGKKERD